MTREEFEKLPTKHHPVDSMPYIPEADKNCITCKGMGIVDIGNEWGCALDRCPDCYNEHKPAQETNSVSRK